MTTILKQLFFAAIVCGCGAIAGEPNQPPSPVPPKSEALKPTTPPPSGPAPTNVNTELVTLLLDMKDGDAAKRDAAGKILATKGAAAHRSLTQFLSSPDADLVKRTKEIRAQIEAEAGKLKEAAQRLQDKALSGPLTVAGFDEARKAWITAAQAAPLREFQQNAVQGMQQMQQLMGQVELSLKTISEKDAELAAKPAPGPLGRASIHLVRAQSFNDLQRFDEALKAAQDAFEAGGRESRLAPSALRLQAEMQARKVDNAAVETTCKKLIAEYAESLEAKFAYGTLTELCVEGKRWDEAVEAVKKYIAACPLDEEAQTAADALLDTLMEKERDYPRAYGLASWIKQRMPISRVRPEVLKDLAMCSEYALQDLAKAEIAYKALATNYADLVNDSEVVAIVKRVKAKIAGTFPKEPKAGDEGPAGALGQYIAAVRARDAKSMAAVVPDVSANEETGKLTCEECQLIRSVTFANYVVKKADIDGDKASIVIDYYDTVSDMPRTIVQKAIKEKGAWKIQWSDPEEQLNPTPATAPKTPKVPGAK